MWTICKHLTITKKRHENDFSYTTMNACYVIYYVLDFIRVDFGRGYINGCEHQNNQESDKRRRY